MRVKPASGNGSLVRWLGLRLTGVDWVTGSLWLITFIRGIVAAVWLYGLSGREQLLQRESGKRQRRQPA